MLRVENEGGVLRPGSALNDFGQVTCNLCGYLTPDLGRRIP